MTVSMPISPARETAMIMKQTFRITVLSNRLGRFGWAGSLIDRLGSDGHRVDSVASGGGALPAPLTLLMDLERMVHRLRLPDAMKSGAEAAPPDDDADVVIVLGDANTPVRGRCATWRVLYDGATDELALFAAIIDGRMPVIDVIDAETGTVLASGLPGSDNAGTVTECFAAVMARTRTLLAGLVGQLSCAGQLSRPAGRVLDRQLRPWSAGKLAGKLARSVAFACVRRLYKLCCHAPHWRIGWRFADRGTVWSRGNLGGTPWTVLADPGTHFYADPFAIDWQDRRFVFFEDLDHRTNKGIIAAIEFGAEGPVGGVFPVLEEPWHLSYPHLVVDRGQVWMIPESSADRTISIYRAERFPDKWVRQAVLIDDIEASDATVVHHDGRYWMFAATRDGAGSWSDTLSIFHAPDLFGPWQPHAGNPLLIDAATARPAGNVVKRGGRLFRPVQDCVNGYGTGIGLAEITHLDEHRFEQRISCVLRNQPAWPGRRLHTLNSCGTLELIDGSAHSPKNRFLARQLEDWSLRRNP